MPSLNSLSFCWQANVLFQIKAVVFTCLLILYSCTSVVLSGLGLNLAMFIACLDTVYKNEKLLCARSACLIWVTNWQTPNDCCFSFSGKGNSSPHKSESYQCFIRNRCASYVFQCHRSCFQTISDPWIFQIGNQLFVLSSSSHSLYSSYFLSFHNIGEICIVIAVQKVVAMEIPCLYQLYV